MHEALGLKASTTKIYYGFSILEILCHCGGFFFLFASPHSNIILSTLACVAAQRNASTDFLAF
jgi:hypothetical protein